MSKQTPEKLKEFEQRVNEGRIGFSANHNTISSQMVGDEMLARSFYTPNRYVVDKLDVEPSKLALINDFILTANTEDKNTYEERFGKILKGNGIMVYFNKSDLPKSEIPEQDGIVRISELSLIDFNE